MSSKYTINDPEGLYFITTAVVKWADVFTREHYKDIISIVRKKKVLSFMPGF